MGFIIFIATSVDTKIETIYWHLSRRRCHLDEAIGVTVGNHRGHRIGPTTDLGSE